MKKIFIIFLSSYFSIHCMEQAITVQPNNASQQLFEYISFNHKKPISKEKIEEFLKQGADLNYISDERTSLLSEVVFFANPDILKFLLNKGMKINTKDKFCPIVCSALINNKIDNLHVLLKYNPNINDHSGNGYTALYHAVATKQINLMITFLKKDADPFIVDRQKQSPLHEIATKINRSGKKKSISTMCFLLAYAKDPKKLVGLKDKNGKTAADLVNDPEVKKMLDQFNK